jgi:hypothetical protein
VTSPPGAPRRASDLESLAAQYANKEGLAPGIVRLRISFTIIATVLQKVRAFDNSLAFMIKGGVAIERRLDRPRTTKDMDLIFRDPGANLIDALDEAFSLDHDGWTIRRNGEPEALPKAIRIEARLEYRGKPWGTVPLEISELEGPIVPAEHVQAFDLSQFGLQASKTLSVLPLRRQVAQKFHAMTEPPRAGAENRRFRDLFDLWFLRDKIPLDPDMRFECIHTFRVRKKHAWPPKIVLYESWHESLKQLAAKDGNKFPDAVEAAADVEKLLSSIEALSKRVFASEYAQIPEILQSNTDLRDRVYGLVQSEPIHGKALDGGTRSPRFRQILERLVSCELTIDQAIVQTSALLGRTNSPHASENRVFPHGWEERIVRTQYSRFYNQAVLQALISEKQDKCFIPHSSTERRDSACTVALVGKTHETQMLLEALEAGFSRGDYSSGFRVPHHPHCTHVICPIA